MSGIIGLTICEEECIMQDKIISLRLKRQHLSVLASEEQFDLLVSDMSPIPTLFWIEPGSLPDIQYRFDFDTESLFDLYRRHGRLLKGRFQGGNVGYVFAEEFLLYKAAYEKTNTKLTVQDQEILDIITNDGEVTTKDIKEQTGLLVKEVSKSLQKLQKAFIIIEIQTSKNNGRYFTLLSNKIKGDGYEREDAQEELIKRFIKLNVWASESMVKSFTKFTNKDIKSVISGLEEKEQISPLEEDGILGYVLTEDLALIEATKPKIDDRIYVLDLADYYVRSNDLDLKAIFQKTSYKTLHYLLENGQIIGRVLGHFRFGPNDLEDVDMLLTPKEAEKKRQAVIDAIDKVYANEDNYVKCYMGASVK